MSRAHQSQKHSESHAPNLRCFHRLLFCGTKCVAGRPARFATRWTPLPQSQVFNFREQVSKNTHTHTHTNKHALHTISIHKSHLLRLPRTCKASPKQLDLMRIGPFAHACWGADCLQMIPSSGLRARASFLRTSPGTRRPDGFPFLYRTTPSELLHFCQLSLWIFKVPRETCATPVRH